MILGQSSRDGRLLRPGWAVTSVPSRCPKPSRGAPGADAEEGGEETGSEACSHPTTPRQTAPPMSPRKILRRRSERKCDPKGSIQYNKTSVRALHLLNSKREA